MTRRTTVVILTALVALGVFAGAALMYQRNSRQQAVERAAAQSALMVRAHSPTIGPATASATIVEFFDPACEACRAFYPHVKQILAAHPRDARLVIRYAPFHREPSISGVHILEAARQQNLFEPVLDALLQSQPIWANHHNPAPERAWEFARAAGLDLEKARAHVATGAPDRLLEKDVADLQAVGVRSTPTFFVNGRPLSQPDPNGLRDMVTGEIERARRKP